MTPNISLERTNPRALAALGRCGLPLSSGVRWPLLAATIDDLISGWISKS